MYRCRTKCLESLLHPPSPEKRVSIYDPFSTKNVKKNGTVSVNSDKWLEYGSGLAIEGNTRTEVPRPDQNNSKGKAAGRSVTTSWSPEGSTLLSGKKEIPIRSSQTRYGEPRVAFVEDAVSEERSPSTLVSLLLIAFLNRIPKRKAMIGAKWGTWVR